MSDIGKELVIVKLGGSAITHKDRPLTPRIEVIKGLASEIRKILDKGYKLILVHGGGSFGHYMATLHGINRGDRSYRGYLETRIAMLKLNELICKNLMDTEVPVAPIHPSCTIVTESGIPRRVFIDPIKTAIEVGYVPVLHGDVVLDVNQRYSIISGDTIIDLLTDYFPVDLVIFGMNVDGIYDRDPSDAKARLLTRVNLSELDYISGRIGRFDVTGGILSKLNVAKRLARKKIEVVFLNITKRGTLMNLLSGGEVIATRILANESSIP